MLRAFKQRISTPYLIAKNWEWDRSIDKRTNLIKNKAINNNDVFRGLINYNASMKYVVWFDFTFVLSFDVGGEIGELT